MEPRYVIVRISLVIGYISKVTLFHVFYCEAYEESDANDAEDDDDDDEEDYNEDDEWFILRYHLASLFSLFGISMPKWEK